MLLISWVIAFSCELVIMCGLCLALPSEIMQIAKTFRQKYAEKMTLMQRNLSLLKVLRSRGVFLVFLFQGGVIFFILYVIPLS